ncbi:MAG TPA: carboxypeptidase-like regulatory domain-containing protein, partial [Planctomycetaceae bacterium]|nr:carboxypeptidase-like regulatory domain-containing protein [Planctomycetaceae bacterium]
MERQPKTSGRLAAFALFVVTVSALLSARAEDSKSGRAPPSSKPASAPAPSTTTFDLRIVGPDGKPIPNVEVDFLSEPRISPEDIRRGRFVSQASYGATLQPDGEGRISVLRPTDWKRLEICIDAPGYARFWRLWQPYLRSDPIPVELTAKLEAGWSVGGTIVDSRGKPIAGARIFPPSEPAFGRVDALKRFFDRAPRSDAEGRWRFDCVPLWRDPVIVEVDHPQFLGRG